MKLDAAAFVDLDGFGEQVVYTPVGGNARCINAIVFRDEPENRDGVFGASKRYQLVVYIRNDCDAGMTEINSGGDTIKVAAKLGGTVKEYQVKGPQMQDNGMWRLELS